MQQSAAAGVIGKNAPRTLYDNGSDSGAIGAGAGRASDISVDICVIGGGAGGLAVAAAVASFGQSVALIEKHKMGGGSLNYGSVPSKALIAAARRAHQMRTAAAFGIGAVAPAINYRAVNDHVHSVVGAIAPNYSAERFGGLGVQVIIGSARFLDKRTVAVAERKIRARRFVIATGSSPIVPPVPGLDSVAYFSNESIFENKDKLERLIVIGGCSVAFELAQAHARLGSRVTVLSGTKALPQEDPEMTAVVLKQLRAEGIDIREETHIDRVEAGHGFVRAHIVSAGSRDTIDGTHVLVAAGRKPNLADLNLTAAGIKFDHNGIAVNAGLRTSNRRVFAIGDAAAGSRQLADAATYHADIFVRRALFRQAATVEEKIAARVTFTAPELAHVGLTEEQAKAKKYKINVLRWPYHENDRAQAERATFGHIKVVTDRGGAVLGASIAGEQAGELIQIWSLAVSQGLNIKAMTGWAAPYPTLGEISKRAAIRSYAASTGNTLVRRAVKLLAKLG